MRLPYPKCLDQHGYRPFVHKTFTELSRAGGKASISSMKTRLLEGVKLLTTKEATTILGCHLETLYQWVKQGKIGCIRTGRNLRRPFGFHLAMDTLPSGAQQAVASGKAWLYPAFFF